MKNEYKCVLEGIMKFNAYMNLASPVNNAVVGDAVYDLMYINSEWQVQNKRSITNAMSSNQPGIIIVLESPHIGEFDSKGKGLLPLQNDKLFIEKFYQAFSTSKNLSTANTLNTTQSYSVYLINAIQYQCSLGLPTECYRDYIFLYYWETMYSDFEKRLQSVINDNTIAIINLCTKGKHSRCTKIHNCQKNSMDYMGIKCGKRFMKKLDVEFPHGSQATDLQNLVEIAIKNVLESKSLTIPYTTGMHPAAWYLLNKKLIK